MAVYNFIIFLVLIGMAGMLHYVCDDSVQEFYAAGTETQTRQYLLYAWDYLPGVVLFIGALYLWNSTQKEGPY